jgi:hypothetical protein
MYETKKLNAGFIILCPDPNIGLLQGTVKSLKNSHTNIPYVAIVPGNTQTSVIKELKEISPVVKGKDTITSLLNTGLRNAPADWGIYIMGGTWLRIKLVDKYSRFIENDTDVLYPIVPTERKHDFKHCTLNGLCINKKLFKKVGPFAEKGALEKCKEEWSLYACGNNAQFKAILGAQIC